MNALSYIENTLKFIGINDIYHDPSKPSDALRYIDWNTGPDYPRILDNNDIDKCCIDIID